MVIYRTQHFSIIAEGRLYGHAWDDPATNPFALQAAMPLTVCCTEAISVAHMGYWATYIKHFESLLTFKKGITMLQEKIFELQCGWAVSKWWKVNVQENSRKLKQKEQNYRIFYCFLLFKVGKDTCFRHAMFMTAWRIVGCRVQDQGLIIGEMRTAALFSISHFPSKIQSTYSLSWHYFQC